MKVQKRDGKIVDFNKDKIRIAIEKAMKNGSGIYRPDIAIEVADEIERVATKIEKDMTIYQIEDLVFSKLVEKGQELTARAYEGYRAVQEFKRIKNTTDESILGLGSGENKIALMENSNKQEGLISTQRDLIAEEISKDLSKRYLLPADVVQAHEDGLIYLHDLGHFLSKAPNCMLINLSDMLQNGTVINRKLIEKPKSLRTATTIASQIVAQIASGQFGKHL